MLRIVSLLLRRFRCGRLDGHSALQRTENKHYTTLDGRVRGVAHILLPPIHIRKSSWWFICSGSISFFSSERIRDPFFVAQRVIRWDVFHQTEFFSTPNVLKDVSVLTAMFFGFFFFLRKRFFGRWNRFGLFRVIPPQRRVFGWRRSFGRSFLFFSETVCMRKYSKLTRFSNVPPQTKALGLRFQWRIEL